MGKVERITGSVVERSQHELAHDGVYYQFIVIQTDDGDLVRVERAIAFADTDFDITCGEHATFHIRGVRNIGTGFRRRNFILATESRRGVSMGPQLGKLIAMTIYAFLTTLLISPFLYLAGWVAGGFLLYPLFGSGAAYLGSGWVVVAFLHMVWNYATLCVDFARIRARLLGVGGGREQILPGGQKMRTI